MEGHIYGPPTSTPAGTRAVRQNRGQPANKFIPGTDNLNMMEYQASPRHPADAPTPGRQIAQTEPRQSGRKNGVHVPCEGRPSMSIPAGRRPSRQNRGPANKFTPGTGNVNMMEYQPSPHHPSDALAHRGQTAQTGPRKPGRKDGGHAQCEGYGSNGKRAFRIIACFLVTYMHYGQHHRPLFSLRFSLTLFFPVSFLKHDENVRNKTEAGGTKAGGTKAGGTKAGGTKAAGRTESKNQETRSGQSTQGPGRKRSTETEYQETRPARSAQGPGRK